MATGLMPDRDLVDRLKEGDESALTGLMLKYHRYLAKILYDRLGDSGATDAVANAMWLRVWEHRESIHQLPQYEEMTLLPWLVRVAVNASIDEHRRRTARKTHILMFVEPDYMEHGEEVSPLTREVDPSPSALEMMETEELAALVHHYIDMLRPDHRAALLLRMGGLAETELAEKLGVNKETGKIWVFRARAELKKLLRRARTTPIDSYHSLTLNAS